MRIAEFVRLSDPDLTMNRKDLSKALTTLISGIREELKAGRRVELRGLGVFSTRPCKSRKGRDFWTWQPIPIKAGRKVCFKPSASLKRMVNRTGVKL